MLHLNLDTAVFGVYLIVIAAVGVLASSREKQSDDYFLAGRKLTWWVIGGSMIAANISTHHFIGMSGLAYQIGLGVASFEWIAAIALVLSGAFFLPYYLKSRIMTMPEFLERRFSHRVRLVYAIICLVGYVFIELAVVLYTGSLAIHSIFGLPLSWGLLILCLVGGGYAIYGGFKAVAYTDIIQVTVLLVGGLTVTLLGLHRLGVVSPEHGASVLGGLRVVLDESPEKFHMVRPWNDPDLPWIGVFFGGMWLANIWYWGCNQFITQHTLAARNIWHGQMGVVFAGFLKLLVPLLVVLPGIIAFRLYHPETGLLRAECVLEKPDLAFPTLVRQLLPPGLTGLVMAGLMGCVMSHIASMVSASSSILTFDIYQNYVNPGASSPAGPVRTGRVAPGPRAGHGGGVLPARSQDDFRVHPEVLVDRLPCGLRLFLAGFFYKRANARGSLVAIIAVPTWSALFTFVQSQPWFAEMTFLEGVVSEPVRTALQTSVVGFLSPFLNRAMVDFALALFLIWIFRTRGSTLPAGSVVDRSFSPDVAAAMNAIPWWQSFRLWAAILVICVAALYIRYF